MSKKAMDILNKLATVEKEVFDGNVLFISPVLKTSTSVATRIANIEYSFSVSTKREAGWYALRAFDAEHARIIRAAQPEEIEAYQKVFPKQRLIAVSRLETHWLALLVGSAEPKIVHLHLSEGLEIFDYVDAIGFGEQFWFVAPYSRRDPIILENIRENFRKEVKSPKVNGILPDERKAYAIAFALLEESRKTDTQRRLESALKHGNAKLVDYREHGNMIVVNWEFDGHKINSTVNKANLTVTTAGICLTGQDQNFDLASLPSVYREKLKKHKTLRNHPEFDAGDDD